MAEAAYASMLAGRTAAAANAPRHAVVVRITHWITAGSVAALIVSGVAILLAHPRLYWGETGAVGAPSLLDLPLPFVLTGQSGWGRYLHFLAAWVCVLSGLSYVVHGLRTRHFRDDLLPSAADLTWASMSRTLAAHLRLRPVAVGDALTYNTLQRLTYLAVVFVLFPLIVWSGLAMSPAITSVFASVVTLLGGQQSARTLHFFAGAALVIFVVVHVAMVGIAGFTTRMRMMITGRAPGREAQS